MEGSDLFDELDRAQFTLSVAYERARAIDYQPGSRQMLDLHLAEQHYEQVRSERDRVRTGPRAEEDPGPRERDTAGGGPDTDGGNGSASRVIDLREKLISASEPGSGQADPDR